MPQSKTPLVGLKADRFRHPLDLQATRALKQLPGMDVVVRTLLGPVAEEFFYLDNIASGVLVSERQLPDLHRCLLEACKILDLDAPQLYVRQHPIPNAYTFAIRGKRPFIVLHTALVDLLNAEELQAVIAHELGHLKCDHGVYLTLANIMMLAASQLPAVGTLIAQGLQNQMMEWLRCAELTCDRAALLAVQDPKVVISVLMKLAGGSPTLASQLNVDAFLDQARAYDRISDSQLGELLKQAQVSQLTHPLPVLRAREIDRWASSATYADLLKQPAIQYNGKAKPEGEWRNW